MFRGHFHSNKTCAECGVTFEREAGFFLGSIYFNYGLTALVVAVAYPLLLFRKGVDEQTLLWSSLAFTVLFPIWFFRYARALWAGFDEYWDPREQSERDPRQQLNASGSESGSPHPQARTSKHE